MQNVYRVKRRNQRVEILDLGLECDEMEVPYPLCGEAEYFFVGVTEIENRRAIVDETGLPLDGEAEIVGLFAACLFGDTLAAIVTMQSEREPAYWMSTTLAGAKVEGIGTAGLFKKRPAIVRVATEDLVLKFGEPARLFPRNRRLQARRSQELVDLLRAATTGAPRSGSGR